MHGMLQLIALHIIQFEVFMLVFFNVLVQYLEFFDSCDAHNILCLDL